ncbi:MAG: hypothetical protein M3O15_11680, partial [Acidobacteriota bacterium]|nr:hypothetical protein [Acidobacteriota bacterium]
MATRQALMALRPRGLAHFDGGGYAGRAVPTTGIPGPLRGDGSPRERRARAAPLLYTWPGAAGCAAAARPGHAPA